MEFQFHGKAGEMFKKWFLAGIIALALGIVGTIQSPSQAYAQSEGECWAVIVGVSDYQQIEDLNYADDDAQELAQLLSPIWGQEHIKLLLNREATKAHILEAIDWMAERADADDTVLFFFCGHGSPDGYIAPYNANFAATFISHHELGSWLDKLRSKRVVIILNTCYAGRYEPSLGGSGRVVLMSSSSPEVSWETGALQNNVFTYYILQAVDEFADANHDHVLSAEEVFQYAEPETVSFTTASNLYSIQHPVLSDGYSGELSLLVECVLKTDPDIPSGTPILEVDNQPYSSGSPPHLWTPDSTHNIKVGSPADTGRGIRYVFTSWGDGNTSPSRTVSNGGVYEAKFNTEYQLTFESDYGEPQGEGWYKSGSTATISVASIEGAKIRYIFTGWSGDYTGSETTASITMDSPKTITANWQTEYLLAIESDYGEPQGAGWYKAGEMATISAPSNTGIVIRHIFTGWSGDYSGTETIESVTMDLPKTITANWRTDCTQLYILIAGLIVLAAVAIIILRVRRRRAVTPVIKMEFAIPVEQRERLIPPAKIEPATAAPPVAKAKLLLPGNSEIQLSEAIRLIGRWDFEKVVSAEALRYISRQHLLIRYDNGKYLIEDLNSANGTKVNGIEIKGKGWQELKDGDRIDIADVAALTFKTGLP